VTIIYSIIIPAFNEELFLPETLAHLQAAMDKIEDKAELIVVDNNSTDDTAKIAANCGARVVFEEVNQISKARNAGAKVAKGEYLIFLDADTNLNEKLIRSALQALRSGVICGGGTEVDLQGEVSLLPRSFLNIWNITSKILNIAAGCFIFCLREAFESVNGFSEEVYASEEIWLSRRLRIWGKKRGMKFRIIASMPVYTSARKLEWYSIGKLVLFYLPILIFPPLVRVRYFCNSWYQRPGKHQKGQE
jgi:glycosyltransferase involved in cell wall biosynthesis